MPLGFEDDAEVRETQDRLQKADDGSFREFLKRVYWGYHEGEEGTPEEEEGLYGFTDIVCANGG
jgi:hypothetical protein